MKWYDFILLLAALVFCNEGPVSRAATVCIALLICLAALLRLWPRIAKPVWARALVSAAPPAVFAVSLLSGILYDANSPLWQRLNGLVTGRLQLAHAILTETSVAIAGQGLWGSGYVADNCYVWMWVYSGPVASFLLWGAVTVLLWQLMKKGALTECACLVVMLAHAFMECHFTWPCINVCLWLLPCALYLFPAGRAGDFSAEYAASGSTVKMKKG